MSLVLFVFLSFFIFDHVIVAVHTEHSLSHRKIFFFFFFFTLLWTPCILCICPVDLELAACFLEAMLQCTEPLPMMRWCQSVTVNNPAQLSLCVVSNKHYSLVGCSKCLFTFMACTLPGKDKGTRIQFLQFSI